MRKGMPLYARAGILCGAVLTALVLPDTVAAEPLNSHANLSQNESLRVHGDEADSWTQIAEKLRQPPVDAKVDRVWRAVPGLNGWELDVAKSKQLTTRAHDGQVHLQWKEIEPSIGLRDLPPEPVYRGPKAEKSATLMFNVSWGEEHVEQILDTLKKTHTKATFFLDGAWVKKNSDVAREIAEAGQDIGSHGQGHPDFRRLSTGQLEQQIVKSAQIIEQTTNKQVKLIAPPSGSFDKRLVTIASQHNMRVIMWTVDTIDWQRPPAATILRRVNAKMEPGSLILMHPTASTAQALPSLIQTLKSQGYVMKTVQAVTAEESAVKPPKTLSGRS